MSASPSPDLDVTDRAYRRANFWPRTEIRFWWSFGRLCVRCAHMTGTRLFCSSSPCSRACGDDATHDDHLRHGTDGALRLDAPVTVTVEAAAQDLTRRCDRGRGTRPTLPAAAVSIACADDIVPDRLHRARPRGHVRRRGHLVRSPVRADAALQGRAPAEGRRRGATCGSSRSRAGQAAAFFPPVANRVLDDKDALRVARDVPRRRADDLPGRRRRPTPARPSSSSTAWNAIVGISMGGNAAMSIGLRHPDRFDMIADLGGEPGPSMVYSLGMVRDFLFGGFCTAADEAAGRGMVGQLCPNAIDARRISSRSTADFEHMIYSARRRRRPDARPHPLHEGVARPRRARSATRRSTTRRTRTRRRASTSRSSRPTAATRCANPIVLHELPRPRVQPRRRRSR